MKIEYDVRDDFFNRFNLAYGINSVERRLIKDKNIKIIGYLSLISYFLCFLFIPMLILDNVFNFFRLFELSVYSSGFCFIIIIIYFINIFTYACNYLYYERNLLSGVIEIKDIGISNKNNKGFEIIVPYDRIELIVITDDLVVFVIYNNIMFIDNNMDIDVFIKEIHKYSDVQIINRTN